MDVNITFNSIGANSQAAQEAAGALQCADDNGNANILGLRSDLRVAAPINSANGIISASPYGVNTVLSDSDLYPGLVRYA